MEKKRYIKVTLLYGNSNMGSYIVPMNHITSVADDIVCLDIGEKYLIEVIEMTEEEFKAIPEFVGF